MKSNRIRLIDTTLRDGEQAPGVAFDLKQKLHIASLLDKAGIPEVEVGTPVMGKQEIFNIKVIAGAGFKFKTLAWCRATLDDIDAAAQTGTQGVNISFPVSDIHLLAMAKDYKWVFKTMREVMYYASSKFDYITVGAQDASRADFSFLADFIGEAVWLGSVRIRIADTVGILNPLTTAKLFRKLRKYFPKIAFEFHGHNDLGMATANTFTALCAGANSASVTVNGIGERAGNCSLEEIVMALELSSSLRHRIKTEVLGELSDVVSKASGIPVPPNKPITGEKVLSHETGIHTNLLRKNRETYQIIRASAIGRMETEFVIGKHSGKASLLSFLERNNMEVPSEALPDVMLKIKKMASSLGRSLNAEEVSGCVQAIVCNNPVFSHAIHPK